MSLVLIIIARCLSFLAGLFFLATLVCVATHFSPIIIHTGDNKPDVWGREGGGASWELVATLGGTGLALLAVAAILSLFSAFWDRDSDWF
jgi:hypothetical protein